MLNHYNTHGKLIAQPGKGSQLQQILLDAAAKMENLPDCYCYIVGVSDQEPDAVYIYEVWKDQAAHRASLEMEVFQELIRKARPIISGMEDFPSLTIIGGKF